VSRRKIDKVISRLKVPKDMAVIVVGRNASQSKITFSRSTHPWQVQDDQGNIIRKGE